MRAIAVFSGRFHPFHRGHKASYDYLVRRYGAENVFVASTNTQAPLTSPFAFEEKKQMMIALGIPANKIVQVKNPYKADEITSQFDPNKTALVFAVSEKDAERFSYTKKDGSPSYMQPLSDKIELQPLSKHAYVELAPTVKFTVAGQEIMSATAIRQLYINGDDNTRVKIIADLYGTFIPAMKKLFDRKLGLSEAAHVVLAGWSQQLFESATASYRNLSKQVAVIREKEAAAHNEFNI